MLGVTRETPRVSRDFACSKCEANIGEAAEPEENICNEVESLRVCTYPGSMVSEWVANEVESLKVCTYPGSMVSEWVANEVESLRVCTYPGSMVSEWVANEVESLRVCTYPGSMVSEWVANEVESLRVCTYPGSMVSEWVAFEAIVTARTRFALFEFMECGVLQSEIRFLLKPDSLWNEVSYSVK